MLCLFSADYVTSHSRKLNIALRMSVIKFSQPLDHLVLLLLGLSLIQLPCQLVCYYTIFMTFTQIQDIQDSNQLIDLIDKRVGSLVQSGQFSDQIQRIVNDTKWPVASVQMFLKSIDNTSATVVCQKQLSAVDSMLSHITNLVASKQSQPEFVDLMQIVCDAVDSNLVKIQSQVLQINVFQSPKHEQPIYVKLSGSKTQQILASLIQNAIRFNSSEDIKIVVTWKSAIFLDAQAPQFLSYQLNSSNTNLSLSNASEHVFLASDSESEQSAQEVEEQKVQQPSELNSIVSDAKKSNNQIGRDYSFQSVSSQQAIANDFPNNVSSIRMNGNVNMSNNSVKSLQEALNSSEPNAQGNDQVKRQPNLEEVKEEDELSIITEASIPDEHVGEAFTQHLYKFTVPENKTESLNVEYFKKVQTLQVQIGERIFLPAEVNDSLSQEQVAIIAAQSCQNQESIEEERKEPPVADVSNEAKIRRNKYEGDTGHSGSQSVESVKIAQDVQELQKKSQQKVMSPKKEVQPTPYHISLQSVALKQFKLRRTPHTSRHSTLLNGKIQMTHSQSLNSQQGIIHVIDQFKQQRATFSESEISFAERQSEESKSVRESEVQKEGVNNNSVASILDALKSDRDGDWEEEKVTLKTAQEPTKFKSLFGQYTMAEAQHLGSKVNLRTPNLVPPAVESASDALVRFKQDQMNMPPRQQRRQSIVKIEHIDPNFMPKTIRVHHPVRARSKSITLPNYHQAEVKSFPITRLNKLDPTLRKQRGSIVSLQSSLQSIEEDEDYLEDGELKKLNASKSKPKNSLAGEEGMSSQAISPKRLMLQQKSILNFGHGRRNNLVKVAEDLQEKSRARSVIILDQENHHQMLQNQIEHVEGLNQNLLKQTQNTNQNQKPDKSRTNSGSFGFASFASSSLTESEENKRSNSSGGKSDGKKSVFALSYNFSREVQKASKIASANVSQISNAGFGSSFGSNDSSGRKLTPQNARRAATLLTDPNFSLIQQAHGSLTQLNENQSSQDSHMDSLIFAKNAKHIEEGTLVIEVIDQGIGCSSAELQKLESEQEFAQVKTLATEINASLTVESKGQGQGATYTLSLETQAFFKAPHSRAVDYSLVCSMKNQARIVIITDDVAAAALQTSIKHRSPTSEVERVREMTRLVSTMDIKHHQYVVIFDSQIANSLKEHLLKMKARHPLRTVLVQMRISDNQAVPKEIDFDIDKSNFEKEIEPIYNSLFGAATSQQFNSQGTIEDCINSKIESLQKPLQSFVSASKVPVGCGVVLIVDADSQVKKNFNQQLLQQTELHMRRTMEKMTLQSMPNQVQSNISKISIPSICLVEADSGEEGLTSLQSLLSRKIQVHLIVLDTKMNKQNSSKMSCQNVAMSMRQIEARSNIEQPFVIIGCCEDGTTQTNEFLDAVIRKPIKTQSLFKLAKALTSRQLLTSEKNTKILRSFKKLN